MQEEGIDLKEIDLKESVKGIDFFFHFFFLFDLSHFFSSFLNQGLKLKAIHCLASVFGYIRCDRIVRSPPCLL